MDFWFFLILLVFLFHLLKLFKNNKNVKTLRPPPSPPALPIIGHLHLLKNPLYHTFQSLSQQYGPIFTLRFGSRPVLIVSSQALAEECFTKNDIIFANRPRLMAGKHLGYNFTSLAWVSYGPLWRSLRRITTLQILSAARLNNFTTGRTDEIRGLICKLFREPGHVELKPMFTATILSNLLRMITRKRYYGSDVVDHGKAKRFDELIKETLDLGGSPNVGDMIPFLRWFGVQGREKRMIRLQKDRDEFVRSMIEEESGMVIDKDDQKALIGVLLSLQESEPDFYTDQTIKGIIVVLLVAGFDTTVITMEWAMSLLLNNPDVLKKASDELDAQVGCERLVEESDLQNLPYVHAVIKETIRLYPAGPLLLPHESSENCIVGGYEVQRGTMLLVNALAIHRDPQVWAEPMKFKPERFMGEGGVEMGGEGCKLLITFGYGRRSCPGMGMAMRVMGLMLASLIQCFDWDRVGNEEVDMSGGSRGLAMFKAKPLEVMCTPRPAMMNVLSQL